MELGGIKDWFEVAKKHILEAKKLKKIPAKEQRLWDIFEGKSQKTSKNEKVKDWEWCDNIYTYWETGRYVDAVARWSQSGVPRYYAEYDGGCGCDRKSAGCGAIAMAQVMKFYQHPNMNMCYNGDCLQTDYPNMDPVNDYSCGFPIDPNKRQISILTRLCGNASNSGYGVFGNCNTWTWPGNIDGALEQMGYSDGGSWDWLSDKYQTVKNELMNYHPVIFTGTLNGVNANDAHIWVADGYAYLNYQHPVWECVNNDYPCYIVNCENATYEWISMNWGWGGSDNGYYYAGFSFWTSGGTYDSWLRALTGIRP